MLSGFKIHPGGGGVGGELRAAAAEQEGMEETLQRETAGQINV